MTKERLNKIYRQLESEWMRIQYFGGCQDRAKKLKRSCQVIEKHLGEDFHWYESKPSRTDLNESYENTLARNGEQAN